MASQRISSPSYSFQRPFCNLQKLNFHIQGKATRARGRRTIKCPICREGGVRKAGNRVRVNVQLIDGSADRHVWAERYDRDLEDIFEAWMKSPRRLLQPYQAALSPITLTAQTHTYREHAGV